jgi:hypothetical protein
MAVIIEPKAYAELFYRNPETGEQILVHTSRPCPVCHKPLDETKGLIIPLGDKRIHAECRVEMGKAKRNNG